MEELLLKLTQAINDFNKYLKNEYSSINKNFSGIANSIGDYSIFTLVVPKLTETKINKTFPRANYILVSIDNSQDSIYLSVNSLTKEKLKFRDGSKFEGIFSDLYLTYDFTNVSPMPKVQIYIGYNSKYNPISTVKIADVDSNNPLPIKIVESEQTANYYSRSGNYGLAPVDPYYSEFDVPATVDGKTVKGLKSLLIQNTGNTNIYFSGVGDSVLDAGVLIRPNESFTLDFEPMAKVGYSYRVKRENQTDPAGNFLMTNMYVVEE